nr:MAG TPA: prohead serine protease [Caudoviricetes sp.]
MNNLLLHKKPVMNKKKTITMIKEKNFFQVLRDKKSVKEFDEDEVKGVEIEGYASTKDKDRGHDIVDPQAFKNALDLYMTNPIVLLQHNMEKPIGVVTEATIDDQGLYIKARITQDVD